MKYDKIRGKSVSECMMKLRSQYGSAAIILATREVKEGGILGSGIFSKKLYEIDFMVEETRDRPKKSSGPVQTPGRPVTRSPFTSSDATGEEAFRRKEEPSERSSSTSGGSGKSSDRGNQRERSSGKGAGTFEGTPVRPPMKGMDREVPPAEGDEVAALLSHLNQRVSALSKESGVAEEWSRKENSSRTEDSRSYAGAGEKGSDGLKRGEESSFSEGNGLSSPEYSMEEIRALMDLDPSLDPALETSYKEKPLAPPEPPPPPVEFKESKKEPVEPVIPPAGSSKDRSLRIFHDIRSKLLGAQLSREFTETFLKTLDDSLSKKEKEQYRRVEERSLETLASMIRTVPDIAPISGECRAVMLMGPTGSGKTTSLAKLAARYHILENREVSIYSLDHYRLAATEQLKTYASVMGVPFHAPLTPEEFREQIRRDGAELMLIDTSGIGHNDRERLFELQQFVDACEVRLEKHLVLAANTTPALVEKILLAYDAPGFDKIILTKLDETEFIGAFIEHADKFNRPFSFLTNGQDVPGDIMDAGPMEMARMILREESAVKKK